MQTAANDAGLSVSALICRQTLGNAGPRARRRPAPDMAMLAQLLAQLGKLGGNLNQIAHRMNEYDFGGERELMEMRAEHRAILAQHRALYDALLVGAWSSDRGADHHQWRKQLRRRMVGEAP